MTDSHPPIIWRGHRLEWRHTGWRLFSPGPIETGWMLEVEPHLGGYIGNISQSGIRSSAVGMTGPEALENAARAQLSAISKAANLLAKWGQTPLKVP